MVKNLSLPIKIFIFISLLAFGILIYETLNIIFTPVCGQAFTAAINIKTGECKVFSNTCLPGGWKAKSGPDLSNCDNPISH